MPFWSKPNKDNQKNSYFCKIITTNMKKRLLLAAAAALLALAASAQTPEYTRALDLYGHGMYAEAARLLENIPGADAEGYAALCAIEMQSPGYEKRAEAFLDRWPESLLVPR
jgi:hypothetical protein